MAIVDVARLKIFVQTATSLPLVLSIWYLDRRPFSFWNRLLHNLQVQLRWLSTDSNCECMLDTAHFSFRNQIPHSEVYRSSKKRQWQDYCHSLGIFCLGLAPACCRSRLKHSKRFISLSGMVHYEVGKQFVSLMLRLSCTLSDRMHRTAVAARTSACGAVKWPGMAHTSKPGTTLQQVKKNSPRSESSTKEHRRKCSCLQFFSRCYTGHAIANSHGPLGTRRQEMTTVMASRSKSKRLKVS